tara:strand:- start:3203 stop:3409 length:207 start_codon:yes stop_codon:yes gene_type:complete
MVNKMERKYVEIDLYEVRTTAQRTLEYLVVTRECVDLGKNEQNYRHLLGECIRMLHNAKMKSMGEKDD